jgi:hypothetical protein
MAVEIPGVLWHGLVGRAISHQMTIVNNTRRFIFVHVPKTAGTSVKQYFGAYVHDTDMSVLKRQDANASAVQPRTGLQKHSTALQVRNAVGAEDFDSFFKFSVTRNPFARTVSTYRFLKFTFRAWNRASIMEGFQTLEEFVASDFFRGPGPGGIFRPQMRWLVDASGQLCMDYICRIESLDDDLENVRGKLGLPATTASIQKRNVSGGDISAIASELNSGVVVAAIRRRYARDFKALGYSTEPNEDLLRGVE